MYCKRLSVKANFRFYLTSTLFAMRDEMEARLLEGIVKYLDNTEQLNKLLTMINEFQERQRSNHDNIILTFPIEIGFPLLTDISDDVVHLLLEEPHKCLGLFNRVINMAIEANKENNSVDLDQVHSVLRIKLPPMSSISNLSENPFLHPSGLLVIKGVLIAHTVTTKYCKSAVYKCPLDGCPGNKGQRMHGDQINTTICSNCDCNTEEFLQARVNGDQIMAVFLHPDSFQNNISRHQGVTVCLKDDLARGLELGVCYNVVVSKRPPLLLGWGIEKTTSEHEMRFSKNLPVVGIPLTIVSLEECIQETSPSSPWALTATLSSQLAPHLFPLNSFFHLKIGLLLSLASQTEDNVPVPVLAVGPDCYSLMQDVSCLSRRRVVVTGPSLCGNVAGSAGSLWLEAGPLLLATGGVCYLGDWAKFGTGRSNIASQIITALESGRADLTISNNQALVSPPSYPLRAAVWTFWSGDKATSAAQAQLRTLIEVFGMPLIGDGSLDIESVAEFRLLQAMQLDSNPPCSVVPQEDLKQYLNIACSLKVGLTPEASRLLRNYFVASRRERPDCLPLTAIKTMTALAEGHTRLCLRTKVTYEDVVLVAYLYEEAISALFQSSVMSPPPNLFGGFSSDPKDPPIGQQVHHRLKSFTIWLEQYITSLINESSINSSVHEE